LTFLPKPAFSFEVSVKSLVIVVTAVVGFDLAMVLS
jgi:hypothetical protein